MATAQVTPRYRRVRSHEALEFVAVVRLIKLIAIRPDLGKNFDGTAA
jgi:hypothetical protein